MGKDRIKCRIDPSLYEEVIKKRGCHRVKMGGRENKGYVYIDCKNRRGSGYWITLTLDFNKRAKSKEVMNHYISSVLFNLIWYLTVQGLMYE